MQMSNADEFPELAGIDTTDGLKRMMNKPALFEKVLRDFHARFRNQQQAIAASIAAGNFADAERQAHSVKGLAGTIGALPLQAAAKRLEQTLHAETAPTTAAFTEFADQLQIVVDAIGQGFGIID